MHLSNDKCAYIYVYFNGIIQSPWKFSLLTEDNLSWRLVGIPENPGIAQFRRAQQKV